MHFCLPAISIRWFPEVTLLVDCRHCPLPPAVALGVAESPN